MAASTTTDTAADVTELRAALWAHGWRPLAVYSRDKRPKGDGWGERARLTPPEAATAPATDDAMNTGELCDQLRPLDMDIEDRELVAQIAALAVEKLGRTIIRHRANSGRCLMVYRAAEGSPHKKSLAGKLGKLEFLGHGNQFVSHGTHPSGAKLEWHPKAPEQVQIGRLPAITEEQVDAFLLLCAPLIDAQAPVKTNGGNGNSSLGQRANLIEVAEALKAIPNDAPTNWEHWNRIGMACWGATHGSAGGFDAWCAWSEQHPSFDKAEALDRWANYDVSPPDRIGAGTLFHLAKEERRKLAAAAVAPSTDWREGLHETNNGYKGDEHNCHHALAKAPALAGNIGYDVRRRALVILKPGFYGTIGRWASANTAALTIWLQSEGIPAKPASVDTALAQLSMEYRIDPLEDYLLGLQWDGTERLGHWTTTYLGAADTPTNSMIGSKFLIGMVARGLKPGCKMDYALCLEGPQGAKKSQVAYVLGGEYTSEDMQSFNGRDAQQIAGSNWVIEVAEMAAVSRSDLEKFKAFLTVRNDTFIPKYERYQVTIPRWCVFILTVNPGGDGYLVDPTGNRRVWPITVTEIDIEALKRDRDQLLAEAVACFQRGDLWWPENAEQTKLLISEQAERTTEDPWARAVNEWADRQVSVFGTAEVAISALGLTHKDLNRSVAIRIGYILKSLGWSRARMREGSDLNWVYEKGSITRFSR